MLINNAKATQNVHTSNTSAMLAPKSISSVLTVNHRKKKTFLEDEKTWGQNTILAAT